MHSPSHGLRFGVTVAALSTAVGLAVACSSFSEGDSPSDAGEDATTSPDTDATAEAAPDAPDAGECPDGTTVQPQALYVLGGYLIPGDAGIPDGSSAHDVLRATACSDGTLGPWKVQDPLVLDYAVSYPAAGLVDDQLVVLDGHHLDSSVADATQIYVATRNPDRSFGKLIGYSGVLPENLHTWHPLFASDGHVLVVAGGGSNPADSNVVTAISDTLTVTLESGVPVVKSTAGGRLPEVAAEGAMAILDGSVFTFGGDAFSANIFATTVAAAGVGGWSIAGTYDDQSDSAVVVGGVIYIFGGSKRGYDVTPAIVTQATVSLQTQLSNVMPNAFAKTAVIGDYVYLVDGGDVPGAVFYARLSTTETLKKSAFKRATSLPVPRAGLVALAL